MADDFFGDFGYWSAGVSQLEPWWSDPGVDLGLLGSGGFSADPSQITPTTLSGAGMGLYENVLVEDTSLPPDQRVPVPLTSLPPADQQQAIQDLQLGPEYGGMATAGTTPGNASGGGLLNWISRNPTAAAALGLGGIPVLLGLAGVGQQLFGGGGNASTTTVTPNVAPPSATEEAARNVALQGVQQAQQFAFGGPQGTANLLGARVPAEEAAFGRGLEELAGTAGTRNAMQASLNPALLGTLPGLLGTQAGVLGQLPGVANAYLTDPAVNAAQRTQALGMSEGRLPSLDPAIQALITQAYDAKRGSLMRDLLDAGRQRGFAGGLETLREAPGNVAGPYLADLAGREAETRLSYARDLPLLGAQLEASRVGTGQAGLQGLTNVAGAFTTPSSVLGGLGMNLMNINQNIARALGDVGQAGVANRTDFLRALSAPLSVANQTATGLGQDRFGSAPRTQLTEQSPSLLSAFAPTTQLLAGTGGLLSGLSAAGLLRS